MPKSCEAYICTEHNLREAQKLFFFTFPSRAKSPTRRNLWIQAVKGSYQMDKKALLSQGYRAMPQLLFWLKVHRQHFTTSLRVTTSWRVGKFSKARLQSSDVTQTYRRTTEFNAMVIRGHVFWSQWKNSLWSRSIIYLSKEHSPWSNYSWNQFSSFPPYVITIHQRYRQTLCRGNTAICTKVHSAVDTLVYYRSTAVCQLSQVNEDLRKQAKASFGVMCSHNS